ncbi:hypothetical protein M0811_03147 [Anaeramoeba ignava]|uniref:Uncharacterized protein n=1 Tax=Anaeramoeba ignava TaxID=1746090 RepID=A0A9Q0L850_ANAIG|nr:hypothetical protein M0811_03147 [Anaeramoeba ignava]
MLKRKMKKLLPVFLYLIIFFSGFILGIAITETTETTETIKKMEEKPKNRKWATKENGMDVCILMVDRTKLDHYPQGQYVEKNNLIPDYSSSVYHNYNYAKQLGHKFFRMSSFHKENNEEYFPPELQESCLKCRDPHWDRVSGIYYVLKNLECDGVVYIKPGIIIDDFLFDIKDVFKVYSEDEKKEVSFIIPRKSLNDESDLDLDVLFIINNEKALEILREWYNTPITNPSLNKYLKTKDSDNVVFKQAIFSNDKYRSFIMTIPKLTSQNALHSQDLFIKSEKIVSKNGLADYVISSFCYNAHKSYKKKINDASLDPKVFCVDD